MIDWHNVRSLRDELGPEAFEEVVTLFRSEMKEGFAQLARAADPTAREAALHFLRSGALNLGFRDFVDACLIGEARAGEGLPVDAEVLRATFDTSLVAFAEGRKAALG
jgi:histidine phosphotransfer protein HptB